MQARVTREGSFLPATGGTSPEGRRGPCGPCGKHFPSPHPIQSTLVPAYAPCPALPRRGQLSTAATLRGKRAGWVLNTVQ